MIMQVPCPGCNASLRIPAAWLHQPVQCKHCGIAVQLEVKQGVRRAVAVGRGAEPSERELPPQALRLPRGSSRAASDNQRERPRPRLAVGLLAACVCGVAGLSAALYFTTRPAEQEVVKLPAPPPRPPVRPSLSIAPVRQITRDELTSIAAGSRARPEGKLPPVIAALEPAEVIGNRRLLGICVSNYLYHNPVAFGRGDHSFRKVLEDLGRSLKFGQITELSDAAPDLPVPPLKALIEKAVADLCKTSRAQDRIVLVLAGHVLEIDEVPYLLPYDGDSGDPRTLIPLGWIVAELARSPARQKVLILDACRVDPTRGFIRPGWGDLSEATAKVLSEPPAGVQVWTACRLGPNSWRSYEDARAGSIFLSTLQLALAHVPAQDPQQPLPIAELAAFVNPQAESFAHGIYGSYGDVLQLPQFWSGAAVAGVPYNPSEKPPPRVTIDYAVPEQAMAGIAPRAQVEEMLAELRRIPPGRRLPEGVKHFDVATFPLFRARDLAGYEPDNADSPLRAAVRRTIAVLGRHDDNLRDEFVGNLDQLKQEAQLIQTRLAQAALELEETRLELAAAMDDLDKEKSKRWQALFTYVYARLLERKAYLVEYNFLLGQLRSDNLPALDPEYRHRGWRMAARETLSGKGGNEGREAATHLRDAKLILTKLVDEHKGTPYAVAAARDAQNHLGMEWQPTR